MSAKSEHLMKVCLKGAVPMWYAELKPRGIDYWMSRKGICAQEVAEKGDVLMYGSKKKGAAGEVFNRLAEGCALLMLITQHPFDNLGLRFHPDGRIEDLSDLQEENQGASESQEMQALRESNNEAPENGNDSGTDCES